MNIQIEPFKLLELYKKQAKKLRTSEYRLSLAKKTLKHIYYQIDNKDFPEYDEVAAAEELLRNIRDSIED
jgi:hypothetical protein